jgi:hypothetical protein
VRTLTLRELNRTLLVRQSLARRSRVRVVQAVARLVALQAQYAPSPYVALWSRVDGFRKQQLTRALAEGSIVKAGTLRTTLHVTTREDYPALFSAFLEAGRRRTDGLGVDLEALRGAVGDRPLSGPELHELGRRVLETDDRWTVAFAWRALPLVRTAPVGPWPHTKPSPYVLWPGLLPGAAQSAAHVVRAYLRGYGPASREDIAQFTFFKLRQIDPVLDGLRSFEDEQGRLLHDVPRGPIAAADGAAPVRFLPAFDSIILAHRDRTRILPDAYRDAVINKRNATTKQTFTVDGFVAGAWRIEKKRGRWALELEAFAPLPLRTRRELDDEGERLVAFYES